MTTVKMHRRDLLRLIAVAGLASQGGACGDDEDVSGNPSPPTDTPVGGGNGPDTVDDTRNDASQDTLDESHEPPPEYVYDGPLGPESIFAHGVASGDPWPRSVVLWTRVSTDDAGPLDVWWEVALDADFAQRIVAGIVVADPDRDYTAKVEAEGLQPGTTYYYRFFCLGRVSPVGRTRTAPIGSVDHLRFAVVSCSNFPNGYFNVYRSLAEDPDLDAVLHLGDYIYEYGGGSGARAHLPPREILSLADYRERYGQYRRDADLQAVHQQHPFIPVWDDHESANNSWVDGAQNHDPATEGDWQERKAASIQAWFEWMPVRDTPDERIWRVLRFGDLVDLVMLDTRLWGRDQEAALSERDVIADPTRTLLGMDQEAWLHEMMSESTARWRLIGQQVMMGQLVVGGSILNPDQWDGYPGSRNRFLDVLESESIDNVVVLTGDIHTSWAMDVARDPNNAASYNPETGRGSLAVEFVTPSVTSSALAGMNDRVAGLVTRSNPHMKWFELSQKGFVLVDVTPERTHGGWHFVSTILDTRFETSFIRGFSSLDGTNHLVAADTPAPGRPSPPALAPGMPPRPR